MTDYEDLAARDPEELVEQVRETGRNCSLEQVTRWQFHARAYQEGCAQFLVDRLARA